jgi:DNA-binding MarR family transcriptional regulator
MLKADYELLKWIYYDWEIEPRFHPTWRQTNKAVEYLEGRGFIKRVIRKSDRGLFEDLVVTDKGKKVLEAELALEALESLDIDNECEERRHDYCVVVSDTSKKKRWKKP